MTNIRERFVKEFPEWKNKNAQALHVLFFFKSELEMLAEEMGRIGAGLSIVESENTEYEKIYYGALKDAATIIRAKASELVNKQ